MSSWSSQAKSFLYKYGSWPWKPQNATLEYKKSNILGLCWNRTIYIQPQQHKITAITSMTPPTTKKLLRSFLGMISFYKIFIPQASELTGPLSNLLRKAVRKPLLWTEDLQQRFELLKLPDPFHPFVLRTDASSHSLGAVLLQYYEDRPHPVAYACRKVQERERRYSTIERVCLALVYGIQRFDYYLWGKRVHHWSWP